MERLLRADDFPLRVEGCCALRLVEDVHLSLPDGGAALTVEATGAVSLDLAGHRLTVSGGSTSCVVVSGRDASLYVLRGVLGPCSGPALAAAHCAALELEDVRVEGFRDAGLRLKDVKETTLRRVELCDGAGAASVAGLLCEAGSRPSGLTALGLRVLRLRADRAAAVLLSGLRRARLAALEVAQVSGSVDAVGVDARCTELVLDTVSVRDVRSDAGEAAALRLAGEVLCRDVSADRCCARSSTAERC